MPALGGRCAALARGCLHSLRSPDAALRAQSRSRAPRSAQERTAEHRERGAPRGGHARRLLRRGRHARLDRRFPAAIRVSRFCSEHGCSPHVDWCRLCGLCYVIHVAVLASIVPASTPLSSGAFFRSIQRSSRVYIAWISRVFKLAAPPPPPPVRGSCGTGSLHSNGEQSHSKRLLRQRPLTGAEENAAGRDGRARLSSGELRSSLSRRSHSVPLFCSLSSSSLPLVRCLLVWLVLPGRRRAS